MSQSTTGRLDRIAIVGTHAPRRCGIAMFSSDLADALEVALPRTEVEVCAVNDPGETYDYPRRVTLEITEGAIEEYRRAGDALNDLGTSAVSIQHEYGIYGGVAGAHLLALTRQLRRPFVLTLHTVLTEPSATQRAVMDELTTRAARVVVMGRQAVSIVRRVHGTPPAKIQLIPHGIPSTALPNDAKRQLGLGARAVLLTYGLLSPGKGIETVIAALPRVAETHPDVTYVVLGATHPGVLKRDGERYRDSLMALAHAAGVESRVSFRDRFVTQDELAMYLGAADVYITPYLHPEQTSSGTLAYALGAGKAVISTPYRYARELLAGGRGSLVPCADPAAMGAEIEALLSNGARRAAMAASARSFGLSMHWPTVAGLYAETLARVAYEARESRSASPTRRDSIVTLPQVRLDHLEALTDSTGVLQHSSYGIPRYADGYCLDDNARALLFATALAGDEDPSLADRGRAASRRYLAFVTHAFDAPSGRFRNFMSFDRTFSPQEGSEDCHGRALWALGHVIAKPPVVGHARHARELFRAALPAALGFSSPRAWAYTLLGLHPYLECLELDDVADRARTILAQRLLSLLEANGTDAWPWFEKELTYANARLSQALIVSGTALDSAAMSAAGLRSLEWLAVQQHADSVFSPIGATGWWREGGPRARFDQQPIEAAGMVSACLSAFEGTHHPVWARRAGRTFAWFLGFNDLQQCLVEPSTGACRDGLHEDHLNENHGAESTLSFLTALLEVRHARAGVPVMDGTS